MSDTVSVRVGVWQTHGTCCSMTHALPGLNREREGERERERYERRKQNELRRGGAEGKQERYKDLM